MAYEKKDLEGTLFNNDKRAKETDPHKTGWIKINGQEYWVSAWENEGGRISMKFKIKQ